MRNMKDSKFKWLGQIPEDWQVIRVKDGFTQKKSKAHQEEPIVLSLARSGVKIRDMENAEGQFASSYYDYNPVDINDMLINPMDLISGDNCSLSKVQGVISPAYVNLRYKEGFIPEFYQYYFKYQYWSKAFFAHGKGVSFENRWTINTETLMKFPLVVPPTAEQQKIADFLNDKCSKIDSLYSDIEKQIEVLKEYKKSAIYEAVTKGLDKTVEMKDSKIKWVGQIPVNWEVGTIKRYCLLKTGKTPSTENIEWFDGDLNWYTPGDFSEIYKLEKSSRTLSEKAKRDKVATIIPSNSVLVIGIGGTAGKVGIVEEECSCNQQVTALIPYNINYKYLLYWMSANSTFLKETAPYTTLPILNNQTIGNYPFICPNNKKEQEEIANFLDKKCSQIDEIISLKEKELETLEGYKKSLIYEYVTGKKEVE